MLVKLALVTRPVVEKLAPFVGSHEIVADPDTVVTFGYDYSVDGIPAAPGGAPLELGLRLPPRAIRDEGVDLARVVEQRLRAIDVVRAVRERETAVQRAHVKIDAVP